MLGLHIVCRIRQKYREERASNINAANRTLFTIFQQLNFLKLFQRDFIDPIRNHPIIFLRMQPSLQWQLEDIQFDFANLGFLLNTKYKQIVLELFIEQQRFHEAIKVINYRSELHIKEAQPALILAGIKEAVDYPAAEITQALNPLLRMSLQRATDQVIYHVDRTVGSLYEIKEKLIKIIKELYPEGNFLNFELLEQPEKKS